MVWHDMYNSVPIKDAPLLMMVQDNDGNKFYSHATQKDGFIYHQTKDGEVESFHVTDVYRREHIYYIYVNDIILPDQLNAGEVLLKNKQEAIAILTNMGGEPEHDGWINLMPRPLTLNEKGYLDAVNDVLDPWEDNDLGQNRFPQKYVAYDADGNMRCYMLLTQEGYGNFVYGDMRNIYFTMCRLSDNGAENVTLLSCEHDITERQSVWAIAFYPYNKYQSTY